MQGIWYAFPVTNSWIHVRTLPQMYKHSNNKMMTCGAIAAMLSTILYGRRFFPYYVYNIIGGLDEEGKGLNAASSINTHTLDL